jgi:hypothetical protein
MRCDRARWRPAPLTHPRATTAPLPASRAALCGRGCRRDARCHVAQAWGRPGPPNSARFRCCAGARCLRSTTIKPASLRSRRLRDKVSGCMSKREASSFLLVSRVTVVSPRLSRRAGEFEQVAQQALAWRPGVLRDEVGLGFKLAPRQDFDDPPRYAGPGHDAEQRVAADRQHMRGLYRKRGNHIVARDEEFGLAEAVAGLPAVPGRARCRAGIQGQLDLPLDHHMQLGCRIAGSGRWPGPSGR